MKRTPQNGITLVALVITIIILLILVGISILALTNQGLFTQAENAKKETKRAQVTEWLNLKLMEEQMYNPTGMAEEIIEATRVVVYGNIELEKMGKTVVVDENTTTIEDGEQVAVYFYVQVDEDVYKVEMAGAKFIGEAGKFPPIIKLESITGTTNSITVKIKTSRNEEGKIEFYIKKEGETEYIPKYTAEGEEAKGIEYTYAGLEQNKNYSIKIVATAKNEQIKEYTTEVPLGGVPSGEGLIAFTPVTWSNGKASTTISSTETGYTIQYQINSTSESGWTTGTTVTGLEHNDKLYARLWDGTNGGIAATNNILDGIDPSASIILSATNTSTNDSITATVTQTDNESGVNIANCKWVYNTTASAIGIDASSYTGTFSSNPQTITLSSITEGTYYLHILTTDVAGRTVEIISNAVTVEVLDGAVAMPINDITKWLKTAGISKEYSYTTIEQVIADSICTERLMNNENAMKYLARSTEFADAICASETTMTYLGQSAYIDDTVLNSDIWVSKIKLSSYWDKIYTQQFTIYGGAYETITITGCSGSFTTNADGSVTHALPYGMITLNGSVSGQSFTRNVSYDTTEVRVMPDDALYWYGNECTWITGGWVQSHMYNYTGYSPSNAVTKYSNRIHLYANSENDTSYTVNKYGCITTNNKIDVSKYNKVSAVVDYKVNRGAFDGYINFFVCGTKYVSSNAGDRYVDLLLTESLTTIGKTTRHKEYSSSNSGYITITAQYAGNGNMYGLWLSK